MKYNIYSLCLLAWEGACVPPLFGLCHWDWYGSTHLSKDECSCPVLCVFLWSMMSLCVWSHLFQGMLCLHNLWSWEVFSELLPFSPVVPDPHPLICWYLLQFHFHTISWLVIISFPCWVIVSYRVSSLLSVKLPTLLLLSSESFSSETKASGRSSFWSSLRFTPERLPYSGVLVRLAFKAIHQTGGAHL